MGLCRAQGLPLLFCSEVCEPWEICATLAPGPWPLRVGLGLGRPFPSDGPLSSCSLAPLEGRRRGGPGRGALCELGLLAVGFQAFEVQLVLRRALPDIWTVLRDQAVSPPLEDT